jgi:hypothetical protein
LANRRNIGNLEENPVKTTALMISLATLLLGASVASAQTNADEHAAHHPAGAQPTPNAPQSSDQAKVPAAMSRMQDNMKTMQELMAKVRSSKDPAERQQLMQEHMKAMHEQMDMMRGMRMGAGQMMGGDRMPGGTGAMSKDQGGASKDGGMMNHDMMMGRQMMQNRVDMMQMMMEQMLQHQEMQEDSKARK